jgi:DNA helicase-2/ATP-dependent DNA helicase PcrA
MSQTLLEIKDRAHHDRINLKDFIEKYDHPGAKKAFKAISCYESDLKKRFLLDFSTLEEEFLNKLQNNELQSFLNRIKIIMVDEYQDTNLLQENIYFEIADAAIKNGGSIIVVGDDDQSLYRFRGATVDLFKDFKDRIKLKLNVEPLFINLSQNYRSTENIVDFCNSYVFLDQEFQNARIKGKESIISSRKKPYTDFPVLGMFREDIKTLAKDLADFIHRIIQEDGFDFSSLENEIKMKIEGCSPGDIALLYSSPMEQDFKGNPRLSYILKDELSKYNPQTAVFNPRGQHLGRIPLIELICGLILECIDPEGRVQSTIRPPRNAVLRFKVWRSKALNYMNHPGNEKVKIFIDTWKYELKNEDEEIEIPIADLISKIIQLMPKIRDDDEFIYVEVITKTITQTGLFSDFKSNIILNDENQEKMWNSTIEAIWNIFVPIALGAVSIDLDILEDLPKNRINIMSIHQSKGLEFQVVIVDVGSDFKMNYAYHSFRRFPGTPGKSCTIEDKMREFSLIGKNHRPGLDRAFDDLIRQYFVAFSRSKDILLLVGLNSVKDGYYFNGDTRYIPNVATGWNRDGEWFWGGLENLVHF